MAGLQVREHERTVERRCPWCHDICGPEELVSCLACGAWQHAACMAESGRAGACAACGADTLPLGAGPRSTGEAGWWMGSFALWSSLVALPWFALRGKGEPFYGLLILLLAQLPFVALACASAIRAFRRLRPPA